MRVSGERKAEGPTKPTVPLRKVAELRRDIRQRRLLLALPRMPAPNRQVLVLMMAEDYCELNDLPASMCAHCRGLTLDDPPPTIANRFIARFRGTCSACELPICEGDNIGRTSEGEYVCQSCANRWQR